MYSIKLYTQRLHTAERQYQTAVSIEIEDMYVTNPRHLWGKIKRLEPRKNVISNVNEHGHVFSDETFLFERCKQDFEKL